MDTTQVLYPRLLETRIAEAMAGAPVFVVAGPRQAGKARLVRQIAAQEMRYLTLDDELTLLAAKEAPVGLIRSLDRAVIDEIQRVPQLLLAIKKQSMRIDAPAVFSFKTPTILSMRQVK